MITQIRSLRKSTGGRYKSKISKRKFSMARSPSATKIGSRKPKSLRCIGGNRKVRLLSSDTVNVLDPKTKKHSKATIQTVDENPANQHFIRRNILTKGSIVDTDKGKVKITSRPGQQGSVDGILVQ
ncbi:30S ribosomal protein S8e [Nanoarchaeota archaeon]